MSKDLLIALLLAYLMPSVGLATLLGIVYWREQRHPRNVARQVVMGSLPAERHLRAVR